MEDAARKSKQPAYDYETAKRLIREGDSVARGAIASSTDTRPEILYFMADDPDADTRRRIAENSGTPVQADLILARDESDDVRCVLATKIARLFPETSETERSAMRHTVLEVLEVLAADQAVRIRKIVSDALKDVSDVPRHLIWQLANDPALAVCGPVLEFSPVLTDEDLIELIQGNPAQGARGAISRRETVNETVSNAIAATRDKEAIAELLANPSAQIREETLDRLIDEAPAIEAWHAPLVHRPKLPVNAARRIAGFVAHSLLDTLRQRTDLGKKILDVIERAVATRLAEEEAATANDGGEEASIAKEDKDSKLERAAQTEIRNKVETLNAKGLLNEEVIAEAVSDGDRQFVVTALSLRSDMEEECIQRIFTMRSSKGIVSLCWKASLSMALAVRLQFTLANISPKSVLRSKNERDFPLTEEDMVWQLEFFENSST